MISYMISCSARFQMDGHGPSVTKIVVLAQLASEPRTGKMPEHACLTASQWVSPSPSAAASRDAAASMVASAGKSDLFDGCYAVYSD